MSDKTFAWHRRRLLQNDSSPMSVSQPSFIILLTIIIILIIAIIIAGGILIYRTRCRRRFVGQLKNKKPSNDEIHLTHSATPTSTLSYSVESSRGLFSQRTIQQNISTGQSVNSMMSPLVASRLNQQSMIDAYLNDFNYIQPKTIDPKQLNSYLFVDLHSTSSETYAEQRSTTGNGKDNTTTSGYDTSTGADDKNSRSWSKYRRRRLPLNQRYRRRSGWSIKRSSGPRFLMRERSLANNALHLPQLRQNRQLFNRKQNSRTSHSSVTPATDSDLTSGSLSLSRFEKKYRQAPVKNRLKTIEEEKPCFINSPYLTPIERPNCFFEKVSTSRGDESDLGVYDDMPFNWKSATVPRDNVSYIESSIIV